MLREILIRLPSEPSSLLHASTVCKRWRGLVTDPKFHRQFYAHHRKPPLLGIFAYSDEGIVFTPVLDAPDRAPPERFDLGACSGTVDCYVLDCRHGLVLVKDSVRNEVVVCAPITGERRVSVPPEFKNKCVNGAVLCAAPDLGHVHGGCHSSPFKVILMGMYRDINRPTIFVYSSETGIWGNLISTETPYQLGGDAGRPATLVGSALYWLSRSDRLIEFDLDGQRLALIMGPLVSNDFCHGSRQIVQAENGAVGFAILSYPHFQMWQRNINGHGVATWMPWKTIEMDCILGFPPQNDWNKFIWGYDEDNNVIFVYASRNVVYAVQLKSMNSKKLYRNNSISRLHPFTSFYTPGTTINGGYNVVEMLHHT